MGPDSCMFRDVCISFVLLYKTEFSAILDLINMYFGSSVTIIYVGNGRKLTQIIAKIEFL